MTLFEKFGFSQDWLRYGVGPMYLRTEQGYMPLELSAAGAAEDHSDPAARCKLVTVYSMFCDFDEEERMSALKPTGKLALPSSFAEPETLVLRMHANNMSPTVRRGAYIGVNSSDVQPLSGGVFVLRERLVGLLVRRIFLDCGSARCYVLRSDDAKYPESVITADELCGRIVGRVKWVMQKVGC
jgi:phage repressor protein C with HTH and peptisase S24 domain